jgi:hypothetical protein
LAFARKKQSLAPGIDFRLSVSHNSVLYMERGGPL